jgi:hypothetical protein
VLAQVGGTCRLFASESEAESFLVSQLLFQEKRESLERCLKVVQRLLYLAESVSESFPERAGGFRLHVDEHAQTVVASFGSLVVSVAGDKFNVEMIVNFLKKERHPVCFGVTFDTVAEIIRNSPHSQTCVEANPDALHLSELNAYILQRYFSVSP